MKNIFNLLKEEDGATAIEYGLIAALISVVAIGTMQATGNSIGTIFGAVSSSLTSAATAASGGGTR